jgi:hypothetical protein
LRPRIYNSYETPRHPPLSCTCSTANRSPCARRPHMTWQPLGILGNVSKPWCCDYSSRLVRFAPSQIYTTAKELTRRGPIPVHHETARRHRRKCDSPVLDRRIHGPRCGIRDLRLELRTAGDASTLDVADSTVHTVVGETRLVGWGGRSGYQLLLPSGLCRRYCR